MRTYELEKSSQRPTGYRPLIVFILLLVLITGEGWKIEAQTKSEKIDLEAINRIKSEALDHSSIMETVEYLTDVIGPRLTGSPGIRKAQDYASKKLGEWSISSRLEAWGPFGRGWSLEDFSAKMTTPMFFPLIAYPKAWSPGTRGILRGEVVLLNATRIEDLAKYKGALKNKIVLLSPPRPVSANFQNPPLRTTDEELQKLANAPAPGKVRPAMSGPPRPAVALNISKWQMIYSEGAAVVVEPGAGDAGTVYVTSAVIPQRPDGDAERRSHPWDLDKPPVIPQIVVAAEQYNRIVRLVTRGIPVQMEVDIKARFYDDDPMSYNLIGEIPGTDLKDEIVMIGGCIDSWHAGTGATDNAAGVAVALEVMRILKSIDPKPRRTIRVGLWSAEELGTFGSKAYVAAHFGKRTASVAGSRNEPSFDLKPEYDRFSCYFNMDYGTGKIRGIYAQGNESAKPIFSAWLSPFRETGASTVSLANIGSTDHVSFDDVGLPGFQFIRDFMEGNTRTAHTNMDLFEHVLEDDLKQSAAVAASFVYNAAMRDEKMPRKPRQ